MLNDRFNIPAVSTKVSCRGDEDEILRLLPSGWAFLGMPKDEWCLDVFFGRKSWRYIIYVPKTDGLKLETKKKKQTALKCCLVPWNLKPKNERVFASVFACRKLMKISTIQSRCCAWIRWKDVAWFKIEASACFPKTTNLPANQEHNNVNPGSINP